MGTCMLCRVKIEKIHIFEIDKEGKIKIVDEMVIS